MSTQSFDDQPNLFDQLGVDDGRDEFTGPVSGGDERVSGGHSDSGRSSVGETSGTLGSPVGNDADTDGDAVSATVGGSTASPASRGTTSRADSSDATTVAGDARGQDGRAIADESLQGRIAEPVSADDSASDADRTRTTRDSESAGINFVPGLEIHAPSGSKSRARANIEAIRLVRTLDEQNRPATAEEQQVLARFSSWGAVPEIFEFRQGWEDLQEELEELLTAEEYAQASRSTTNAHYTDPAIASAMWSALSQAGFTGGTVLEPGCGSGNFIGQAPAGTHMVGVELDSISAKVAHYLYPEATIRSEGFQQTFIPDNGLSAVVGNVPFGNFSVYDRADNREELSIHNYFIHKSMKHLPAGGYGVFITSTGTMDAKTTKHREVIAEHSDLVGAVRLPSGAFSRVAGTGVQSDILIFRRREEGVPLSAEQHESWVRGNIVSGEIDGEPVQIYSSRYFQQNPQNVLGEVELGIGGYPPRPMLKVSDTSEGNLAELVRERLIHHVEVARDSLPYAPAISPSVSLDALDAGGLVEHTNEETAFVGSLRTVATSRAVQQLGEDKVWRRFSAPGRGQNKISDDELYRLVQLKETVRAAVDARGDSGSVAQHLESLNSLYEQYVQEYGLINRYTLKAGRVPTAKQQEKLVAKELKRWQDTHRELSASERAELEPDESLLREWQEEAEEPLPDTKVQAHLAPLRTDPDFGKLVALENFQEAEQVAEKSAYFYPEMYAPRLSERTAETVADALAISLDETRTVSLERIGELLGIADEEQVRQQLSGLVFEDPQTHELVPAVHYLSGDVREKLKIAMDAAVEDSSFEVNVSELEKVLPSWAALNTIGIQPGVQFVSEQEYQLFAREVLGVDMAIVRDEQKGGWDVPNVSKSKLSRSVLFEFGTNRRTPVELLQKLMNNRAIIVHDSVDNGRGGKRQVVNEGETRLARERAQALKERFATWVAADANRAQTVERRFNEMFNAYVQPDYSGIGAGMALEGLAPSFTPHPYQREAVARIVNEPSVLLDHVVGAGKTGSMIMGAMELRRTGVANKPWMVVPNHLTDQISREFSQWYPSAKVLTIPTGITRDERRRYAAMSAGGDWDAVICPQSVFSQIGVSPRRQREWVESEIEALKEAKAKTSDDRIKVKGLESAIARLETRMEKILDSKVAGITFEETGCDYLFVDEAHHYKNLPRTSDFRELACVGSNKAMDMDFILRTLREMKVESLKQAGVYNGQLPSVATFATGTPVANSLAEMWVMAHYLRPDLTEKMGIETIDAFGSVFTKAESSIEVKPSGVGFQVVNRVSKFTNVNQLMQIASMYTSSVTREQIPAKLPEVVTGGIHPVTREVSEHVKAYVQDIVERMENPGENDVVIELLGRARKVALDPRMVGLEPDADGGRPGKVAEEVMRIDEAHRDKVYLDVQGNESANRGGLQLLFCDWGTPGGAGFNMYRAMKDELVSRGMDESRIAFIHDARTDGERGQLFARARAGEISVLIGSTDKMGTGMNVQQRVTAVHHVDLPWRPADLEQREGRAIRQGNQNDSVEILSHISVGTFDAYHWQKLANKAAMLEQLRHQSLDNEVEDIGPMTTNYQELLAEASGNPLVAQWFELSMSADELLRLKRQETTYMNDVRFRLDTAQTRAEALSGSVESVRDALAFAPSSVDVFEVGRRRFATRGEDAGAELLSALRVAAIEVKQDSSARIALGRMGNIVYTVSDDAGSYRPALRIEFALAGSGAKIQGLSDTVLVSDILDDRVSGRGMVTRISNRALGLQERLGQLESSLEQVVQERDSLAEIVEGFSAFARQEELDELLMRRDMLADELGINSENPADTEQVRYLSDDEFEAVSGQEYGDIDSYRELRPGDVIEVRKVRESEFASGFYTVRLDPDDERRTARTLIRPESSEDEADWGEMSYLENFTLIKRSWDGLTDWEKTIVELNQTDESYSSLAEENVLDRIGQGASVSVPVRAENGAGALDDAGIHRVSAVTGSLVSWHYSTANRAYEVVLEDEQGQQETYLVRSNSYGPQRKTPALIVRDAYTVEEIEQRREQALQAELAQRRLLSASRLYPGDRLVSEVEGVGLAGWMVEDDGYRKRFADPATGEHLDRYSFDAFEGDIVEGRDLSEEEFSELFAPLAESATVDELRAGDVVEGQKLDNSFGLAQQVRLVSVRSNGTSSDIIYRPVNSARWEETQKVTRKNSTNIGAVSARRFGALNRTERVILSAHGVETVAGAELPEVAAGTFIMAEGYKPTDRSGQDLTVVGKLIEATVNQERSSWGSGRAFDVLNLRMEVEGEEVSIERAYPQSYQVVVFSEGLPENGLDFSGTSLLARSAQRASAEVVAEDTLVSSRVNMEVYERAGLEEEPVASPAPVQVAEVQVEPAEHEVESSPSQVPALLREVEPVGSYTLDEDGLTVQEVSAEQLEALTDGIATVDENSVVVPVPDAGADEIQAQAIARVALERQGVTGEVARLSARDVMVGEALKISSGDGALSYPASLDHVMRERLEGVDGSHIPGEFVGVVSEHNERQVLLNVDVDGQNLYVAVVPTAEDMRFAVAEAEEITELFNSLNENDALREAVMPFATVNGAEVEPGTYISVPAVATFDDLRGEGAQIELDGALVIDSARREQVQVVTVSDPQHGIVDVVLGADDLAMVDELANEDAGEQVLLAQRQRPATVVEVVNPREGQEVAGTGVDAITGDTVEVYGEVAGEPVIDGDGRELIAVADEDGQQQQLVGDESVLRARLPEPEVKVEPEYVATTVPVETVEPRSVFDGVPYVDAHEQIVSSEPRSVSSHQVLAASQVRVGDTIEVAGSVPLPVYRTSVLNESSVRITVLDSDGLHSAAFPLEQAVNVDRYPEGDTVGEHWFTQDIQRVRSGDVIDVQGQHLDVIHTSRSVGSVHISALDERDETVNFSVSPITQVGVRKPLCVQERLGVRGEPSAVLARELSHGDVIATKKGEAVVHQVEVSNDASATRVHFQFLGAHGFSPMHTLVKGSEETVQAYAKVQEAPLVPSTGSESTVSAEIHQGPIMQTRPDDGAPMI